MSGWLPVRRILRERFGPGGYQILRTGEIRVRRGDSWDRFGSLLEASTLDALRAINCSILEHPGSDPDAIPEAMRYGLAGAHAPCPVFSGSGRGIRTPTLSLAADFEPASVSRQVVA